MQAKPTVSPLQVARSRQAHGFSTKKKKNTKNQKLNPSHHWQNPITSRRRWQRDQTPIQKQTKHRELQQTKHRAQRCLSKKKKSPIHKPKPNPVTHGWSRRRCRRRSSLVVVTIVIARPVAPHHRSQIGDRRTQIAWPRLRCLVLAAQCTLRPSLKVFLSDSLSDSQSLSLYLTE